MGCIWIISSHISSSSLIFISTICNLLLKRVPFLWIFIFYIFIFRISLYFSTISFYSLFFLNRILRVFVLNYLNIFISFFVLDFRPLFLSSQFIGALILLFVLSTDPFMMESVHVCFVISDSVLVVFGTCLICDSPLMVWV